MTKPFKKNRLILGSLAIIAFFTFSACSSPSTSTNHPDSDTTTDTTLLSNALSSVTCDTSKDFEADFSVGETANVHVIPEQIKECSTGLTTIPCHYIKRVDDQEWQLVDADQFDNFSYDTSQAYELSVRMYENFEIMDTSSNRIEILEVISQVDSTVDCSEE